MGRCRQVKLMGREGGKELKGREHEKSLTASDRTEEIAEGVGMWPHKGKNDQNNTRHGLNSPG